MGRSTYRFHSLVGVAILAALATIIMFFEFPVLIWLPFLKVDLSDIVTLIGSLFFGPVGGISIAFIKTLCHWIITGQGVAGLIGDFSNFVGAVSLLLPFTYFWNRNKKAMAIVSGTVVMTIIMSLLNLFVVMPLYMNVVGMHLNMGLPQYVATGVIPFNVIKSLLTCVGVLVIYPRLQGHFKFQHQS
ncbi:ECF transporter S component [Companilactobacillus sp.]|uniref:ECF transporter S component n=1 Tax=Companilactobacillus sp. TaxID=2767905 RepID=UPI0025B9025E|nr:ECF transporter S component [Companilactobacillus sp.]MCH4008314.1 ECF transporter S component [Companilactobacillus sp.]MCH4051507.1 ECF transporter S component [Companilactobacillus sp.]MCH4076257.1 ECF transporter S component [Companilactobacillus sp.]MCH4124832.1 ECF transporter S component [Companilactobacillus sp.]MCH4131374.1 ECF transporter S component [Companilactobacillus sp.]